ncbi:MAG: biotin--[acetyl-CoA-carboxylase] ligase [Natronospirillum sp.]|uniref:biotin--[acetyl-CoA-carboxylase] ligase n=1 Tax=Natronospirillum sp. TaxID=2812955 RepID=UPI0025CBE9E7|nr:biotin--[acetyl-CoA-carboxylase] ligase [Natronospirillum sp.]MCH8553506.1 biotin--[acetyl-CoA-carboxylase] ligase [Natronospirillum sp.]
MDKISQYEILLRALKSERFVSGSALAETLQISRTVVNRRLKELADMGLRVHAVTGKGYHLADPFTLLDDPPADFPAQILWYRHLLTTSTNEDALALSRLQSRPVLVATEYQTQGRGRRGRAWQSEFGKDLAFSLCLPLSAPETLRPYSLAAGVLLAEALRDFCGVPVSVKWPNDLQVNGAKLAGILTELHTMDERTWIVLGIGMNVNSQELGKLDQAAVSLRDLLASPLDRSALLARLAKALAAALGNDFDTDWHKQWPALDALAGKPVQIESGDRCQLGTAAGVAPDGALLVDTEVGQKRITGGQVSVRAL